jgi:hypothetical protein
MNHPLKTSTPRHTIEIPPSLWEDLQRLNVECGKDQTPKLIEAMAEFVADELAFITSLRKSQEQARNRQFASPEKVTAFFSKHGC